MRKQPALIIFCLYLSGICHPQKKTEPFVLSVPDTKLSGSMYNSIRLLDIRKDTPNFGIVQKGGFNRKEKVITETPLQEQFSGLLQAVVDSSAGNGEMLLLLRQLLFAEVTGAMSETGFCYFKAMLFVHAEGKYKKLDFVDTVVQVRTLDVTKAMFRRGSRAIAEFITANLYKEPSGGEEYLWDELFYIDSLEKRKLPAYNVSQYKNGVYPSFRSFINQEPVEEELQLDFSKDKRLKFARRRNQQGSFEQIWPKEIFAFVHEGVPYISSGLGYYPLERKNDDFYFIGKVKNADPSEVAAATYFFGILGGLLASTSTGTFEIKVDHLSGAFIRVRLISQY